MTGAIERFTGTLADRYRIERELGAGGMATVYLAEDLKHGRRVALKVLRPELAAILGADRFLAEIRTTAHLQHPHILPLHDSGEADGLVFYVMPYVEGESLRERLVREKQLPVEDALRIAREVASALDYAHRQGVLHRDIKPENILLHDGQALVADFGIALAASRSEGGTRLTETGMSLGTPHYMSPEQAMGEREITPRSDVYALGCVVYEMLSGDPPFTGSTAQAIVAQVVTGQPRPLVIQRHTIPEHVEATVLKALEKLPADRFATAAEFAQALADPRILSRASASPAGVAKNDRPWSARSLANWQVAAALALVAVIAVVLGQQRPEPRPAIYDVGLPDSALISFTGGSPWGEGWTALTIAPDGDFVVYVAHRDTTTELWYRSLVDTVSRPILGTRGAYHPMLSPDGQFVAFLTGTQLQAVPVTGGSASVIGEVDLPRGAEWSAADRIIVADSNGYVLRAFDPITRSRKTLAVSAELCAIPSVLPGGHEVVCGRRSALVIPIMPVAEPAASPLEFRSEASGPAEGRVRGTHFRAVDESHLVFMAIDGVLAATRADFAGRGAGRPVPLVSAVRREGFDAPGQYALSRSGTLVYVPGDNAEVGRFAKISEGTVPEPLPMPAAAYQRFDLSRDGRRLAAVAYGVTGMELWIYDVATGSGERWLTSAEFGEPRWDPTGTRVLVTARVTDTGPYVTIIGSPDVAAAPDTLFGGRAYFDPNAFVADSLVLGRGLAYGLRLNLRASPPHLDTTAVEDVLIYSQTVSPDGHWLAYASGEDRRFDVYLEPFPPDGRRWTISDKGGLEPLWRTGSQVVFRNGSTWYEVHVDPSGPEPASEPREVFSDSRFIDTPWRSNTIAPDGSVIYVRGTAQTTGSFIRVIPGWVDQMRRRVREAERSR